MRPRDRSGFGVAIICALTLEGDAVEALFDETYDRGEVYGKHLHDTNSYTNGRIGQHNVVLCYMPEIGSTPTANVVSSLRFSYTGVYVALVVGICGGAPFSSNGQDIFLGDVLISDTVIQYDFGRQYPGGFERKTGVKHTLGRPTQEIRSLLASLEARRARLQFQDKLSHHLNEMQERDPDWQRPTLDDVLFDSSFTHKHRPGSSDSAKCVCFDEDVLEDTCPAAIEMTCSQLACDVGHIIRRRRGSVGGISVHTGTIASAYTVMKSGEYRDRLVGFENVLGFKMESVGVWDNIPCILIQGVCDYSDSHKSKDWQNFAAASGASAAKTLLAWWNMPVEEDPFTVRQKKIEMPRRSDESEPEIEEDNALSKLKATAKFLISGRPFTLYKENLRGFLRPTVRMDDLQENTQIEVAQTDSLLPQQSSSDHSEGDRDDAIKSGPLQVQAYDTSQLRQNLDCLTGEESGNSPQVDVERKSDKFLPSLPLFVDMVLRTLPLPESEPPIPMGKVRARWKCRCGVRLFDDYTELESGSVKELERELQELGRSTQDTQNAGNPISENFGELWESIKHCFQKQRQSNDDRGNMLPLEEIRQPSNALPQSNDTPQPNQPSTICQDTLHLLLCIDKMKSGTPLLQEHLEGISTDRELFLFLRSKYFNHWNVRDWFTLRSIGSLNLSRFAKII
ncbi:Pfs NB-ARC and TPR domain protein [Penicillium brevicompactum]|uniref:Pfs NB-ARC and TPR domain protein n=1 Tax=Penicillium brevicompactum TaxID=5074 RepID=A0A9W9QIC7_PENBR|nr:Pfs NB-ARC and TPR domain protein [Penicillium brevicompactum]